MKLQIQCQYNISWLQFIDITFDINPWHNSVSLIKAPLESLQDLKIFM